jgi:hypothetical protein
LVAFPKAQKVHEWIALSGQIPEQFIISGSFREGFMTTNTSQGDYLNVCKPRKNSKTAGALGPN